MEYPAIVQLAHEKGIINTGQLSSKLLKKLDKAVKDGYLINPLSYGQPPKTAYYPNQNQGIEL